MIGVDASQTQITAVGTIGTGTWQGTKVASAYLDDDTAHLSGTQTFSGAKTFGSADLFVANGNGMVIGHTAQITSAVGNAELQVLGTTNADAAIDIGRFSANGQNGTLSFIKGRGGIGDATALNSGDYIGVIQFYGADGTDLATSGANISVVASGTIAENRIPTYMTFSTGTDAAPTVVTEAMRIDSSQNVGIGTGAAGDAIAANLHIVDPGTTSTRGGNILIGDGVSSGDESIELQYDMDNSNMFTLSTWNGTTETIVFNTYVGGNKLMVGPTTTGADGTLHVHTATAGSVTAGSGADDLIVESNGNTGMTLLSPAANEIGIYYGDPDNAAAGRMIYNHATPDWSLWVEGSERQTTTSTYTALQGLVFIADTANASMTTGLTIQQGAADNEILALKSSDVNHGVTGAAETDTYLSVKKHDAASGGARLQAFTESDDALVLFSCHLSDNTTKSTGAVGSIVNDVYKGDGTNTGTPGSNSNLMVIRNGGVGVRFIFDADGDSHQDVGTAWTNFDGEEDAQVCRSVAHVMTELAETSKGDVGAGVMVKSKFDQWGIDHKESLIHMGLIPRLTPEEEAAGDRPLMNMTQLARVHNGAIWQTHIEVQQMKEDFTSEIDQLRSKNALLEQRLNRLEN